MEDETPQINTAQSSFQAAPEAIWRSILGRALFGFSVEVRQMPHFANDHYLKVLCDIENALSDKYGRLSLYSILFSLFSISTNSPAMDAAQYAGVFISKIPLLTPFCILVLGFLVTTQCYLFLDILVVSRMRIDLFVALSGSEFPGMRMLHWKGSNGWTDAVLPRRIGYRSGPAHNVIRYAALLWSLTVPSLTIAIPVATQAICTFSGKSGKSGIADFLIFCGIGISALSVAITLIITLVPLRYKFQKNPD
ncbi:MAG: hypothetical protein KGN33_18260 [Paracoccaceae bacterium]|nr:hypothetical protein [Paracoccaceae bacterium]